MQQILLIAEQISQQGKVPNVAMIKARLPKNVPLPLIIEGLRMWQKNPQQAFNEENNASQEASPQSTVSRELEALLEEKIEQALMPLRDEINRLKIALTELQTTIKEDNQ
ncbi:hypothetical protein [Psychromonas sp. MME2]|uniref:hypothetical protein n=1 Tax=unclassified Psychromonas TaxID=2614957 RepID=UPI00339CB34E